VFLLVKNEKIYRVSSKYLITGILLKELESWLKRGQYFRFLREICPRKNVPPILAPILAAP
jgi:hypothetical protein